MPSVTTRAGEVSYQVRGTGQPIVLLHATLHDGRDYDPIVARLAQIYQTIVVDWPWHGNSKGTTNRESLGATGFADVLEDFVTKLELPPAAFIGNSIGGFAAARLAITHPDKVRALVLVNSGGFVDWTFVARLFARTLGFAFVSRIVSPHLVRRYMSPQTPHDEEITRNVAARAATVEGSSVSAAIWRSFLPDKGHDLRAQAKSIKCPVLLVWGTRDPVVPTAAGKQTQQHIPGSKLELFDTGHVVFSSKPDDFLKVVEPFIESAINTGSA